MSSCDYTEHTVHFICDFEWPLACVELNLQFLNVRAFSLAGRLSVLDQLPFF
jgi:hypothetical protein